MFRPDSRNLVVQQEQVGEEEMSPGLSLLPQEFLPLAGEVLAGVGLQKL